MRLSTPLCFFSFLTVLGLVWVAAAKRTLRGPLLGGGGVGIVSTVVLYLRDDVGFAQQAVWQQQQTIQTNHRLTNVNSDQLFFVICD